MTELEKLKNAVELIESATGGRQQLISSSIGHPFFRPADDSYIHVEFILRRQWENQKYDIAFGAFVRRSGEHLNATGLTAVANELGEVAELLTVLEKERISVTEDELRQWSVEVRLKEEQRETAQKNSPDMGLSL
jgi:hypothetical protein